MPVMMPTPPSTATLVFGIILLFIFPIIGLILIIYYIVKKSDYDRMIIEINNLQSQQNNNEEIRRL